MMSQLSVGKLKRDMKPPKEPETLKIKQTVAEPDHI